jgi:hypothetical protein
MGCTNNQWPLGERMQQAKGNPATNSLLDGVTEAQLQEAVAKSGYPLQAAVVRRIEAAFRAVGTTGDGNPWCYIQEEWTYEDADTGGVRALDALADLDLGPASTDTQSRIRPVLSLLVECKQSELPFVFFTRPSGFALPEYPSISGFPHDEISLTTDDDTATYTLSLTTLWGLPADEFITSAAVAVSVSKATRKGKGLEISGEDTFNGLVLPLRKSVEHLRAITRYEGTPFTDGRIIAAVAVLRAPMVAVPEDGSDGLELVPWVRLHRYEPNSTGQRWNRHKLHAFDVVHYDYLDTYLGKLTSYASRMASEVVANQKVLAEGRGFASSLGHQAWPRIVEPQSDETEAIRRRLMNPEPEQDH